MVGIPKTWSQFWCQTSHALPRSPAEEVDLPDPGAEEEVRLKITAMYRHGRLLLMAEILNHHVWYAKNRDKLPINLFRISAINGIAISSTDDGKTHFWHAYDHYSVIPHRAGAFTGFKRICIASVPEIDQEVVFNQVLQQLNGRFPEVKIHGTAPKR